MVETTEEYRNRINQIANSIENEPYIQKMRGNIAEGISKTGNRQADIEVRQDKLEDDFVAVQQDARSNTPSGAELAVAAGSYNTLGERLDAEQNEVIVQLAQSTGYGIINGLFITPTEPLSMSVNVSSGIVHTKAGWEYSVFGSTVPIKVADSTNPRTDVIYVDEVGQIVYQAGTPSPNANPPILPETAISLSEIYVPVNTISIGKNNIKEKRKMKYLNEMLGKKLIGYESVLDYGAVGDGKTDDTAAIQKALDNAKGTLHFPPLNYKVTGTGEACLYLKRKLNLVGFDADSSRIRADNAGSETALLKVSIEENSGFGDVRNWSLEGLGLTHNGGGKDALLIKDGLQILTSQIRNCNILGNRNNGGKSIRVINNLAHSSFSFNTLYDIYFAGYDANLIAKNLFLGTEKAITYDLITGVKNNTFRDNTVVNRDGAVHIINGSVIRVANNQIELALGQGVNQSTDRSMVYIEGRDRACDNVVVEENNLGGGTSLDYLVTIDNAYKTVVSKNEFVATNIAEVRITSKAKYTIIKRDNVTKTQNDNPRTRTLFKENIVDNGFSSVGVLKSPASLNLQNGWTMFDGFYKTEEGLVVFYGHLNSGVSLGGTVIGTIPEGFRPRDFSYLPVVTSGGLGYFSTDGSGVIKVGSIPSNAAVCILPFASKNNE